MKNIFDILCVCVCVWGGGVMSKMSEGKMSYIMMKKEASLKEIQICSLA